MFTKNKDIYKLLSLYSEYSLFSKTCDFILSDIELQNFLLTIDKNKFKNSQEINMFFETRSYSPKSHIDCVQWDSFLNKYSFKKNYALFFHDLIGHITLKNGVTSKGEILATAGMSGFSFQLGKFYFINAILIFSLGYQLFDDTKSDNSNISNYINEINLAFENGKRLRKYLDFDESLLVSISIEEFLIKNCNKLKDFKV